MEPIVDYESSSEEEEEENVPTQSTKRRASDDILIDESNKKQKMPKLPAFFQRATPPASPSTNQDLHQGRKRTIPHRENSWATYVYFQVDLTGDKETILNKYCPNLEPIPEQHISLSRTVYLKEHQLDPFVESVRKLVSDTKSFTISFAQVAQLTNDEKTRSFVTLEVGNGYNELMACLKHIDQVMKQYHQPIFYNPSRFHTSIAWSLDEESIQSLNIPQSCIDNMMINTFHISQLYIKQGHRINIIQLK